MCAAGPVSRYVECRQRDRCPAAQDPARAPGCIRSGDRRRTIARPDVGTDVSSRRGCEGDAGERSGGGVTRRPARSGRRQSRHRRLRMHLGEPNHRSPRSAQVTAIGQRREAVARSRWSPYRRAGARAPSTSGLPSARPRLVRSSRSPRKPSAGQLTVMFCRWPSPRASSSATTPAGSSVRCSRALLGRSRDEGRFEPCNGRQLLPLTGREHELRLLLDVRRNGLPLFIEELTKGRSRRLRSRPRLRRALHPSGPLPPLAI